MDAFNIQEKGCGTSYKSPVTRRNFLRSLPLAAGALIAAKEGWSLISGEVPMSWRVANAGKVCTELMVAEASKDQSRILRARKLALVWVFAESASLFSDEAGLGMSGKLMEHYLYGGGEDVDISKMFEGVSNDPVFWLGLIESGFGSYNLSSGNHEYNLLGLSKSEFIRLFKEFSDLLRKGNTFVGSVSSLGNVGSDWTYAIGHSTYTMRGGLEIKNLGEGKDKPFDVELKLVGPRMAMWDMYDWDAHMVAGLSGKAGIFTQAISEPLIEWLLRSEGIVDRLFSKLDMANSSEAVEIKKVITWARTGVGGLNIKMNNLVTSIEEWAAGGDSKRIEEIDMNLLKQLGAKDYKVVGSVRNDGVFIIPTDNTLFPTRLYP